MPLSVLTGIGPICWTKNPIVYQFSYTMMTAGWKLEIRLRDVATGTVISTVLLPFTGSSGFLSHDIKAMCDPYPVLQAPLNLSSINSDQAQDISQHVQHVFIDFRPVGVGAPTVYSSAPAFYIIKGGIGDLSTNDSYVNLGPGFNSVNFLPGGSKLLSWLPAGRSMARREWGWIAYLSTTDAGTQFVRYTVLRTNNTSTTIDKNLPNSNPTGNTWKMWLIPVGVEQAKLDPTNIGVWYVDLLVRNGVQTLTSSYRIYCDHKPHYNSLTLFYRNSMGGIDQVMCRGAVSDEYSARKEVAQIAELQPAYYAKTRPAWEMNTGWLQRKQVKAIGFELANTTEAYLIQNEKLVPVRIPENSLKWERKEAMWSLNFRAEVAAEFEIFPRQLIEI